tara:strand:+ start:949 stop:4605 length:3657 start_codon:yes stop_codon:yes gene_type:complete
MANWKKVLVSGSNIEVNQISGSTLNLGGLGGSANDVLIINGDGSVSTLNQSNLTGASQNFLIRGDADGGTNISFQANENVLLFTTASSHGFSFNATDDVGGAGTSSITLTTPQDLRTSATPQFASMSIDGLIRHSGDAGTNIRFENDFQGFRVGGETLLSLQQVNNAQNKFNINGDGSVPLLLQIEAGAVGGNGQEDIRNSHLFFVTESRIGIGTNLPSTTAKLHISGGDLRIQGHTISASLPTVNVAGGLVAYNTSSEGFEFISSSDFIGGIANEISGAFTSTATSIASDIATNVTNISTNTTNIATIDGTLDKGIRFQEGGGTQADGESVILGQTASFIGTANEVTVVHDGGTANEEKFTFGLPSDVTIAESLTVGPNPGTTDSVFVSGGISSSGTITAAAGTFDGTVTAGNFIVQGVELIQNNVAIVSGSTSFGSQSINLHSFTGSVVMGSGSTSETLTVLGGPDASTSVVISNGSINATGAITSSAVSSSGQLFASLSAVPQAQVVTYNATTGEFFHTASSAIQGQNVIGPPDPTDNDYDDGLLDFENSTPVGTAIDQINEVLAGLAPSQAPNLDDIQEVTSHGGISPLDNSDFRLSFGGNNPGATNGLNFTDCTSTTLSSPGSGLSSVSINGQYNASVVSNDRRLGIMSASTAFFTPITGTLNDDITGDGDVSAGQFINFGDNSFGNGDKGVLAIFVNDALAHSQSLSGSFGGDDFQTDKPSGESKNTNGTGFIGLSATQSAHFTATGNTLSVFKHRSGSFVVGSGDQRKGWNHVRVEHQLDGSTIQTNYLEWVTDDDNNAVSETNVSEVTITGTGLKAISGIHYFTGFTATHQARINNAFRNVYNDIVISTQDKVIGNGDNIRKVHRQSFEARGTNLQTSVGTISPTNNNENASLSNLQLVDALGAHSSSLDVTASYVNFPDSSFIGTNDIMDVAFIYQHPIKADIETTNKTAGDIIYDARTDTSTTTKETFISESFRLPSGSYNAQSDIVLGSYIASRSLLDTTDNYDENLLVYPGKDFNNEDHGNISLEGNDNRTNGALIYPDVTTTAVNDFMDNPNFTVYTNQPAGGNPTYASLSGNKTYFRAFKNETSNTLFNIKVIMGGSATVTKFSNSLTSTNIHIAFRYPGFTNYLDYADTKLSNEDLQTLGQGCVIGTPVTSISHTTNDGANIGFATAVGGSGVFPANFIVMRITYGDSFTGYIGEIDLSTNMG